MLILNRTRREKVDLTQYGGRFIPAGKAGGLSRYGASPAALEWCSLEWRNDRVAFLFREPTGIKGFDVGRDAWNSLENGDLSLEETQALWREAEGYADVTDAVCNYLLDAERLATTADFVGIGYYMGTPVGFVPILHGIWKRLSDAE